MDKIMEKLNKLSLPAVILIASIILGGFFYASQVNKQRSIERQQQIKVGQEKQDQLAKVIKEQQAKEETEQALNTCIANAEESYSNYWYKECKSQGKLTSRCISLHEMTFKEYQKEKGFEGLEGFAAYYKERDECSCRLLLDNADRINKSLQDDKDECFKKYPQK